MSTGTVLRWGEMWTTLRALASERPRILWSYVVAGVLIPWLFFFIFPQSNMRGFGAFLLNGGWYSAETPWTIVSMFMIAFVGIGAFVFAAWNALLAETRDEVSGEIMFGFVNSLLSSIVAFALSIFMFLGYAWLVVLVFGDIRQLSLPVQGIIQLMIFATFLFFLVRFCLTGPAMAAEGSINPFFGLKRSWQLTAGHVGKVMLIIGPLYTLAWVLIGLFMSVALAVLMATDGSSWHDKALSAGWLWIEMMLVLTAILVPAAIYRTIRPAVDTGVFE